MEQPTQTSIAKDGFVILKNVFYSSSLEPVKKLVDSIVAYADSGSYDPFTRYYMSHRTDNGVLYDLYQRHPEFQVLAQNSKILDAVEDYLGENIWLYENSLVYKPKGKNNQVPWHQDFLNRINESDKLIAWVALDDVTQENGAMKLIPQSHLKGVYPWYRVKGETHHDRIDPALIEEDKAIYCTLNAGDVLIFHQHVLHSSDLIVSDKPRRAYRISYQAVGKNRVPRGGPIVLRGGTPEKLLKLPESEKFSKTKLQVLLHKIGQRLIEY